MKTKEIIIIVGITLLVVAGFTGAYLLGSKKNSNQAAETTVALISPTVFPTIEPSNQPEPTETEASTLPQGWTTYENSEYGFEISFPDSYKALDDSNNLYGWPNGIVLLYQGGQSYDIAIEIWDSPTEYQTKYPMENLKVEKIGDQYLTVADITKQPKNADIIDTLTIN
ncbi:MAG: hypothetical protein ABID04_03230 [Patescibacteria group bacterium]